MAMKKRPEHHPLRGPLSLWDYWASAALILAFVAVLIGVVVLAFVL